MGGERALALSDRVSASLIRPSKHDTRNSCAGSMPDVFAGVVLVQATSL